MLRRTKLSRRRWQAGASKTESRRKASYAAVVQITPRGSVRRRAGDRCFLHIMLQKESTIFLERALAADDAGDGIGVEMGSVDLEIGHRFIRGDDGFDYAGRRSQPGFKTTDFLPIDLCQMDEIV